MMNQIQEITPKKSEFPEKNNPKTTVVSRFNWTPSTSTVVYSVLYSREYSILQHYLFLNYLKKMNFSLQNSLDW